MTVKVILRAEADLLPSLWSGRAT